MSYKERIDGSRCLHKQWRNDAGQLHREGGPAHIIYEVDGSIDREIFYINGYVGRLNGPARIGYFRDGSICWEQFWIAEEYLGEDEHGFWKLWDILTEEDRQAPALLKYLMRYS